MKTKGPPPVHWEPRFLAKIALPDENGCMNWLAGTDGRGYGRFGVSAGNVENAHRLAYKYWVGDPGTLVIDHLCNNKLCCTPDHLTLKTIGGNIARYYAEMEYCKSGLHRFADTGWRVHNGRRYCLACYRETTRRNNERKARGD